MIKEKTLTDLQLRRYNAMKYLAKLPGYRLSVRMGRVTLQDKIGNGDFTFWRNLATVDHDFYTEVNY